MGQQLCYTPLTTLVRNELNINAVVVKKTAKCRVFTDDRKAVITNWLRKLTNNESLAVVPIVNFQ